MTRSTIRTGRRRIVGTSSMGASQSGTGSVGKTSGVFSPTQIGNIEDTGLSALWLQDHTLKVLYFGGA